MSGRSTQRDRVLARLEQGPATTFQLIMLGICCPTKRISELRRSGAKIVAEEHRQSTRRIVTYWLLPNGNAPVRAYERTKPLLTCAECGQGMVRKHKSRPLLPGEKPFCCDAHRAAYHRRKHASTV